MTLIVTRIVTAAVAAWLPALAVHAADVTVRVFRPATDTVPDFTCTNLGGAALTVSIPPGNTGTCSGSGITITAKPGATAGAQVAALTGSSQNQVVIKNAVIKNTGTGSVRVEINGSHFFGGVNTNAARSYAIGMNGSFSRKNASGVTVLASGDRITKQGFYTYFDAGCTSGQCTDQVGGAVGAGSTLNYLVPSAGSTTANTIPIPAPSATESTRKCADFTVPPLNSGGSCDTTGERLRTVVAVTLTNLNDLVTIPGGVHTCAGEATNEDGTSPGCNAVLASLTAVARLHQNTPNSRVDPFDNGHLTVELLCNPSFPCENVDQASLRFGPAGAIPKSVKSKDVNGDGSADLQIKVRQQETGIVCGDTSASLTGTADFGLDEPGEFDAIVGFYTGPGC